MRKIEWPRRAMMLADWWSMWSTCSRLRVGAVVVDADFQVLVSAFNGSPRGLPHCNEGTVAKDGHCLECVHAEVNCINQAARTGISVRGGFMYTLYRPCIRCALSIAQVGLAYVYYRWDYDSDGSRDQALVTLAQGKVAAWQMEESPVERDHKFLLSAYRKGWDELDSFT